MLVSECSQMARDVVLTVEIGSIGANTDAVVPDFFPRREKERMRGILATVGGEWLMF